MLSCLVIKNGFILKVMTWLRLTACFPLGLCFKSHLSFLSPLSIKNSHWQFPHRNSVVSDCPGNPECKTICFWVVKFFFHEILHVKYGESRVILVFVYAE